MEHLKSVAAVVTKGENKRRAAIQRKFEDREFNRVRNGLRLLIANSRDAAETIEFLVAHEAPQSMVLFVTSALNRVAWDINALGAGTEPRKE